MYIHIYTFQVYDKNTAINEENQYLILQGLIQILIMNDLIYIILLSLPTVYTTSNSIKIIKFAVVPTVQLVLSFYALNPIEIEGYYKTFILCKILFFFSNFIKLITTANLRKFINDLLKLMDTILIINMILIAITDPVVNSEDSTNAVTFYEIYFRYLEYHTLILALILIYNDRNIEEDVKYGFFTTSAIIGKYDSFKFSCILIFAHYYFPLVNSFAYSFK